MPSDTTPLTADAQARLQRETQRRAAAKFADQAEMLAREMEAGGLVDRGGPDALRLLAALVRAGEWGDAAAGHA
jgi:hypothetical protein